MSSLSQATTGVSDEPASAEHGIDQADRRAGRPPAWFDLVALTGPVLLAVVGSVGLLLAMLGAYTWWAALLIGVPVSAAMLVGVSRVRGGDPPNGTRAWVRHGAAAVAALIAVGYLVFAASVPSQNVIVTRDPGVYMNSARWLSRDGDLDAEGRGAAFAGIEGLRFASAGVYDMGDGEVEFQFNHLSSVAMSVAFDIGGHRALFRLPAVAAAAGLLALYAVAVRVTGRPVIALLAPAVLAVSMPLLFVSRNTYSEPFAFALLWGAALVLADLHRRPRLTTSLVGGALLGAVVSTRVDALLYVALVFPLAALSIMSPATSAVRRFRARAWAVVVASTAVFAAVGIVDLVVWAGNYASEHARQIGTLRLAVVASAATSAGVLVLWRYVPAVSRLYRRVRGPLAVACAALVVVVLLAGWLARPLVQTARRTRAFESVRSIQVLEGVEVDPTRTFAEHSLDWMSWYLGDVTLLAAIGGLGLIALVGVRSGRVRPAALGVFVLTLASGAVYWWQPRITPDHLWVMRRFVPAILPGLAVVATVPLAALLGLGRIDQRARLVAVAALSAAMVVPPAMTTWPLRWQRSQYGHLNPVLEACDLFPEDAAVVVLGGFGGATLPQTLRGWCGVPVAAQGSAVDADTVEEVAGKVRANGYRLVLIGADSRDLTSFTPVLGGTPRATSPAADHWLVQGTVDRPPDSYAERSLPVENPFRLHVLAADPR